MILMDYQQVVLSNLFAKLGNHTNTEIDIDVLRYMILNSLRSYNFKHRDKYGEMILCTDSKYSWRRGVFPYYKARRRRDRKESEIDWNTLFNYFDIIIKEIEDNFPYKVIGVENAEADDIIGTIVKNVSEAEPKTPILILSRDEDFIQLHKYPNVKQMSPVGKKWIRDDDPIRQLRLKIYKGDAGDGVPNVYSPDDVFVSDKNQRRVTVNRIKELDNGIMTEEVARNIARNELLIDLTNTPESIQEEIMSKYNEINNKNKGKMLNYFIEHGLTQFVDKIIEF